MKKYNRQDADIFPIVGQFLAKAYRVWKQKNVKKINALREVFETIPPDEQKRFINLDAHVHYLNNLNDAILNNETPSGYTASQQILRIAYTTVCAESCVGSDNLINLTEPKINEEDQGTNEGEAVIENEQIQTHDIASAYAFLRDSCIDAAIDHGIIRLTMEVKTWESLF